MLNKIKKVFGFSGQDEDDLINDDPEPSLPSDISGTSEEITDGNDQVSKSARATQRIFEHVIAEFNKALPEFLQNCVDAEKQQKYLFDTLDADIKDYFNDLEKQLMEQLEEKWRNEREKLKTDLKQLEQTAKDIESKRASIREKQLSSERQRRALSDRVRDLENQIMTLEAEKEQYELETKSLVNKVKVAQVYEKDIEIMREQIKDLQLELDNAKKDSHPEKSEQERNPDQELRDEIDRLKNIENEYNALMSTLDEFDKKMDEVQQESELKNAEIKELKKRLAETQSSSVPGEEDFKRLQNKLSSTQAELQVTLKALQAAESRAQKAETALKTIESSGTDYPSKVVGRNTQSYEDDILNGTDWTISAPVRRPRKTVKEKKERNDDGELSLW